MKKLIKLEWLKLKPFTGFWIFCSIYAFCCLAIFTLTQLARNSFSDKANGVDTMFLNNDVMEFPTIWHTSGYLCSWPVFLLGIFVITAISNESIYKTNKQNIIDGLSRNQFLHAKWLMVLLLSVAATIFYFILTIAFTAIAHPGSLKYMFEKDYWYIPYFFLYTLTNLGLCVFLGTLMRKTALAVVIYICYFWIFDNLLFLTLNSIHPGLGRYLPLECVDSILDNPFFRKEMKDELLKESMGIVTEKKRIIFAAVALGYLTLYYFITRRHYRNTDL
jgi:ABC-2 type transport system permease protein